MAAAAPPDWNKKLSSLQALPSVTWAGQLSPFRAPRAGEFLEAHGRRYLVTRAGGVDGVVLGVAARRASCFVGVEMPDGAALAVVADSPAVLETVVADVFAVIGMDYAIVAP